MLPLLKKPHVYRIMFETERLDILCCASGCCCVICRHVAGPFALLVGLSRGMGCGLGCHGALDSEGHVRCEIMTRSPLLLHGKAGWGGCGCRMILHAICPILQLSGRVYDLIKAVQSRQDPKSDGRSLGPRPGPNLRCLAAEAETGQTPAKGETASGSGWSKALRFHFQPSVGQHVYGLWHVALRVSVA